MGTICEKESPGSALPPIVLELELVLVLDFFCPHEQLSQRIKFQRSTPRGERVKIGEETLAQRVHAAKVRCTEEHRK
jgi:hypothetical protein